MRSVLYALVDSLLTSMLPCYSQQLASRTRGSFIIAVQLQPERKVGYRFREEQTEKVNVHVCAHVKFLKHNKIKKPRRKQKTPGRRKIFNH